MVKLLALRWMACVITLCCAAQIYGSHSEFDLQHDFSTKQVAWTYIKHSYCLDDLHAHTPYFVATFTECTVR